MGWFNPPRLWMAARGSGRSDGDGGGWLAGRCSAAGGGEMASRSTTTRRRWRRATDGGRVCRAADGRRLGAWSSAINPRRRRRPRAVAVLVMLYWYGKVTLLLLTRCRYHDGNDICFTPTTQPALLDYGYTARYTLPGWKINPRTYSRRAVPTPLVKRPRPRLCSGGGAAPGAAGGSLAGGALAS